MAEPHQTRLEAPHYLQHTKYNKLRLNRTLKRYIVVYEIAVPIVRCLNYGEDKNS